jgi:SAM-dependent methyltransferase
VWLPRFTCPECERGLDDAGGDRLACTRCRRFFEQRHGIWRLLTAAREADLEPFVRQYRAVREREGRRPAAPDYYRGLPDVARDDPHAQDWRVRRETYHHLLRDVLAAGPSSLRVLDLGAGSGWLSHRLSVLGHRVVALDAIDDAADGLGAVRHYATEFAAVQADFDALPFAAAQFDLVVFNGSLHYAGDAEQTLMRADRMLAAGGVLAVMDSPMFRSDRDGHAMVHDKFKRFESQCGIVNPVRPGTGYLTYHALAQIAGKLQRRSDFLPSRGSVRWRLSRHLARVRLLRAPASFGLWVAR